MTGTVAELAEEIRSLPPEEREMILYVLLESLDNPPDPGAEAAWLEEVQRRWRERGIVSNEETAGRIRSLPT